MNTSNWFLFVSHLPSRQSTPRMRLWRGLRSLGAAILRDGVYLLPHDAELGGALEDHAAAIRAAGGTAHVLSCAAGSDAEEADFRARFDRSEAYADWHREAASLTSRLTTLEEPRARRDEVALRRTLDDITRIDFFPGDSRDHAAAAMAGVEAALNARFSPDEPSPRTGLVARRNPHDFTARTWATRQHLWIDRVASAWLIRRRIDPQARFVWLQSPDQCPADAVGFDFDEAQFSHVGERVTFEVLAEAFGLEGDVALARLGVLIRYLDVGGAPVPEAPGVLALLGAARERCDDDAFLDAASALLDDLMTAFTTTPEERP